MWVAWRGNGNVFIDNSNEWWNRFLPTKRELGLYSIIYYTIVWDYTATVFGVLRVLTQKEHTE